MRRPHPGVVLLAAAFTLAAQCPSAPSPAATPMLPATLTATVSAASPMVTLTLAVTNPGSAPVTVEFSSSQQFDFQVRDPDGRILWTWSAGKGFATMLTSRTLAPGETATYAAEWQPVTDGTYSATGMLTSMSHPVEATTTIMVPFRATTNTAP